MSILISGFGGGVGSAGSGTFEGTGEEGGVGTLGGVAGAAGSL